jgi:hypothetical protein
MINDIFNNFSFDKVMFIIKFVNLTNIPLHEINFIKSEIKKYNL